MAEIGSLIVSLVAETGDFVAGMKRAESQAAETQAKINNTMSSQVSLGSGSDIVGNVGSLLSTNAATAKLGFSLQTVANAARTASAAMTGLGAAAASAGTVYVVTTSGLEEYTAALDYAYQVSSKNGGQNARQMAEEATALQLAANSAQAYSDEITRQIKAREALAGLQKAGREGFGELAGSNELVAKIHELDNMGLSGAALSIKEREDAFNDFFRNNQAQIQARSQTERQDLIEKAELREKELNHQDRLIAAKRSQMHLEEEIQNRAREQEEAAAREAEDMADMYRAMGEAFEQSYLTPLERYERKLREIQELEEKGEGNFDAGRARAAALADKLQAEINDKQKNKDSSPGAFLLGTAEAFKREGGQSSAELDVLKQQLKEQQKIKEGLAPLANAKPVAIMSFA